MGTRKKYKWVDFKPGGYDPFSQSEGFDLHVETGQEAINFFSDCITHVRGPKKGQPFVLELWQQGIIGHL